MDWMINPRDWAIPISLRATATRHRGWDPDYFTITLQILCLKIEWQWLIAESS